MPEELLRELVWFAAAAVRLLVATGCGAAIGWEREKHEKSAGLRTHILICLGATLFSLIAIRMHESFGGDFLRLVQGMLLAIGFIGGGLIFTHAGSVKGITTTVGVWVVTGIGLAIGLGYYPLAIFSTLLTVAIVAWLKRFETRMRGEPDAGPLSIILSSLKGIRRSEQHADSGDTHTESEES